MFDYWFVDKVRRWSSFNNKIREKRKGTTDLKGKERIVKDMNRDERSVYV